MATYDEIKTAVEIIQKECTHRKGSCFSCPFRCVDGGWAHCGITTVKPIDWKIVDNKIFAYEKETK